MASDKSDASSFDRASFEQLMQLAPLLMELYDFLKSSNDMDKLDPLSMLMLAAVIGSEDEGVTAAEIAFFLETPVRTVKSKLERLTEAGIIELDGERYRYKPPREMTPAEERRVERIERLYNKLLPTMEKMRCLDS